MQGRGQCGDPGPPCVAVRALLRSLDTGFGPPLLFPDLVLASYPCRLPTDSLRGSAWAPGHARH